MREVKETLGRTVVHFSDCKYFSHVSFFFALYFSYVKQTVLMAVKRMFQRKKGKGNFRKNNCAFSD